MTISKGPLNVHPCLKCGACCAFYRVSFHWSETLTENQGIPLEMTQQISPYMNAMIGTDQKTPSCIGLGGIVGKKVICKIYQNRPECCRSFDASFEYGVKNKDCDSARVSKGLEALMLKDWPSAV